MSRPYTCMVRNCYDKISTRHRFPNPQKDMARFKLWVEACNNQILNNLTPNRIYSAKRICHIHFSRDHRGTNNFILPNAVPTLFLPTNQDYIEDTVNETEEFLIDILDAEVDEVPLILAKETHTMTKEVEHEEMLTVTPPLLQGIGQSETLTPKAKKIYKRAARLQRKNWLLNRKQRTQRKRLDRYENMSRSEIIDMATSDINPVMKQFIMSQADMEGQQPKGRRFSLKDKVLALSFYKQSPKMYRLLSKIFSMPSKNTITRMLKQVPIKPGFNDVIFNNLKCSVEKLQDHEKNCVLIFDEMSIQPHIQMNIDTGNVMGFQHFGEQTSNSIANTVTVFMIKGITKKWKQPVFYGFSANGMKTIDLVRTLKEVIRKCQECGLRVISTICDQGSSNVAAINYLHKRSTEEALRKGEIQEEFTFNIAGKKIIPLYDPPHLIKGIRNNLVKRNLVWERDDEKLTCKWTEIQQAYNMDNHSGETRFMTKLTDKHIYEHKMSKKDYSFNIISRVEEFITQKCKDDTENYQCSEYEVQAVRRYSAVDKMSIGYISGFISKKLGEYYNCETCKSCILCKDKNLRSEWHNFTVEKEFTDSIPEKLKYCTPQFMEGLAYCYNIFKNLFHKICHVQNSFNILIRTIESKKPFTFEPCQHTNEIIKKIIYNFSKLCCYNWCNGLNKVLTNKDDRVGKRKRDPIYNQALEYANKRKKRKYNPCVYV